MAVITPSIRRILVALMAAGFVGCTTMTTTLVERDPCTGKLHKKVLHGVPVTVKVPTHLKVWIVKGYNTTFNNGAIACVKDSKEVPLTDCWINSEFIYTEKLIAVDFKRPAGGVLAYKADFQKQYFSDIANQITDTTITDISKAIEQIISAAQQLRAANAPPASASKPTPKARLTPSPLYQFNSVAAFRVFEIDRPDFKDELSRFLNTAIAECGSNCAISFQPPGQGESAGSLNGAAPPPAPPTSSALPELMQPSKS